MKRENHCQLICAQYARTVSTNTVFLAPALPLKITQPELIYLYTRANETKLVCYRERNATAWKKKKKETKKMVGFSEENIHGVGSQGKELSLSSLFSLEHTVNNSFRIINTVEKIAFRNIIYAFTCLSVGLFSPSFTVEAFHFSFFSLFFLFRFDCFLSKFFFHVFSSQSQIRERVRGARGE